MRPLDIIHDSWKPILNKLYQEPISALNNNILPNISFQPKAENIFRVFKMPLKDIKIVLLGQDPYSTPGDAIGLSFVNGTTKTPASLRVIYKEILNSTGKEANIHTWEEQGVFLLNSALTVETGKPLSHINYWRDFTLNLIRFISYENPCIWFLWGKKAQEFEGDIYNSFNATPYAASNIKEIPISNYNYILKAPHPASEAYSGGKSGFYGCNHFIYSNYILGKLRKSTINW
jgi:uracil-DNA glycosylase